MSSDIKFSKAQISKIVVSGGKTILLDQQLPCLNQQLHLYQIKLKKNKTGQGFTLFISNEHMVDIIKMVESLEISGLLADGATETVKHEINKQ